MMKNHRKVISGGCLIALALLVMVLGGGQAGYAQTPEATPSPATGTPLPTAELPAPETGPTPVIVPVLGTPLAVEDETPGVGEAAFFQLGQSTFELISPLDQQAFSFDIPYRWIIDREGSYLELHYAMQYEAVGSLANQPEEQSIDAVVNIYFNDVLITSFAPQEGSNQVARIEIPPDAAPEPEEERSELRFVYLSGDCDEFEERSVFVVYDYSLLHLVYDQIPVEVNLADFPRPLVQNLFRPEEVLIVVPDEYGEADLEAAASVAATIGLRTFGEAIVNLVTASEATAQRLANTSAIVVGKPGDNAFLQDLYRRERLPTTLSADDEIVGPSSQPIAAEDGVLQEVMSDYSQDHVYLIVTGATDEALNRAAQALSVSAPRFGFEGNLVVVAEYHDSLVEQARLADRFTLAELGFEDTTLSGNAAYRTSVPLFVPSTWQLVENPRLNLAYIHSNLLETDTSSLSVQLNGQYVGSAPIDKVTLAEREAVIEIPLADFRVGHRNRLDFEAVLNVEVPECALPELDLAWVRLLDSSTIEIPHVERDEINMAISLDDPLSLFVSRRDLSDVWFSLSQAPAANELVGLVRVAAWLGNFSGGSGFSPQVSMGADESMEQLEAYHLVAFGRPTTNPLVAALHEYLPQPFVAGEDSLRQQLGSVVYRLPDNYSLGVLEVLRAPWNPGRAVLVVSGTTPQGLGWAIHTLTGEDSYYQLLEGDLALIRQDRVETFASEDFVREPLTSAMQSMGEEEAVDLEAMPTPAPAAQATPVPTAVLPEPAVAATATVLAGETGRTPEPPLADLDVPAEELTPEEAASPMWTQVVVGLVGVGLIALAGFIVFKWRKRS